MGTFFGGLGHSATRHDMDADASIELAVNEAKSAVDFLKVGYPAQAFKRLVSASFQYGMYMANVSVARVPTAHQEKLATEYGKLYQKAFDALERDFLR